MLLVCPTISEDDVIKKSYDFMGGKPSRKLPTLVVISIAVGETCF